MYQIIKVLISLVFAGASILCQMRELISHYREGNNSAPMYQKGELGRTEKRMWASFVIPAVFQKTFAWFG